MIRTYLLTFLLLICLPTVELLAQYASSVSGMVTDERELPLSGVAVYNTTTGKTTFTDAAGYYYVPMRAGLQTELQFRLIGYVSQKHTLRPREGEDRELNVSMTSESKSLPTATITAKRTAVNIVSIPTQAIETIAATNAGVEAVLKTMPGVVSNNELSSQYSVRGGNFDENLVYVNDFEIYRPFLIRSGQQEGSSFINPDMVSSVSFSAGGFEAKYGDRMASVLDVKYRRPREWRGTLGASFLGFSGHLEGSISNRTTISVGIRQKSNQYLLNALPTKGEYAPTFTDMQGFVTHQLHPKWQIQAIGNFASNRLTFLPVESSVAFGTFNDNFKIITAYEGSENDSYQNGMAGVGLIYTPQNNLTLKLLSSGYRSREIEAYNILGFYYIGEIEKDLTKDDFGDVTTILGVGTSHDWARNRLDATIANVEHRGNWSSDKHFVSWGLKAQRERFDDQLNEWTRVDSADFTLPVQTNSLLLKDVLRAKTTLETGRYMAFVQDEWTFGKDKNWSVIGGLRTNYYELNQELLVTPRFQIGWRPELCRDSSKRAACTRDLTLRAAVGLYHQPPLYRELRQTDGVINPDLLAQKSLQMVLGGDYNFRMWGGRPFKLTTEVYYKHLWDLVSYSFDNLLIRYSGQNDSKGYATGIDMRLFGQFIKDTDSWISVSWLKTKENLNNDHYYDYLNAAGQVINIGDENITDFVVADSIRHDIGWVRRPTDQRFTVSMFVQDYIPKHENLRVQLSLILGSGLPVGPYGYPRLRNRLQLPLYRRVDVGFSALLYDSEKRTLASRNPLRHLKSIWTSLEVFNLLGVKNTVSFNYIKAIAPDYRQEVYYAIPNYLTSRRINLRLLVKF
ncbi:MAG: carboxypeptidase-like regulatory domain-containing protein [Chitinophagales bacterium]|jgi:hypothetical protein|nr:carboxypeptidase-like regulatory domain-containing protein [Chitinophagales bacterium]